METLEPKKPTNGKIVVEIGVGGSPGVMDFSPRGILPKTGDKYFAIEKDMFKVRDANFTLRTMSEGADYKSVAVRANAEELPFQDKSVDEVVLTNILNEDNVATEKIMGEALRVMKKEGKVIIIESLGDVNPEYEPMLASLRKDPFLKVTEVRLPRYATSYEIEYNREYITMQAKLAIEQTFVRHGDNSNRVQELFFNIREEQKRKESKGSNPERFQELEGGDLGGELNLAELKRLRMSIFSDLQVLNPLVLDEFFKIINLKYPDKSTQELFSTISWKGETLDWAELKKPPDQKLERCQDVYSFCSIVAPIVGAISAERQVQQKKDLFEKYLGVFKTDPLGRANEIFSIMFGHGNYFGHIQSMLSRYSDPLYPDVMKDYITQGFYDIMEAKFKKLDIDLSVVKEQPKTPEDAEKCLKGLIILCHELIREGYDLTLLA